tara:strand:- start:546 stop:1001 length:456 start_codon:yes stop_codon:yes gene_type:complete
MKKVLLVLSIVALTFSMSGQSLRINETDEFTGNKKKITKFYNIAKTNVGTIKASVLAINSFTFLSVNSTADLGCAGSHKNNIIFLFEDGTTIKLDKDLSDINCKDSAGSLFDITGLDFTGVAKVRFQQSEYYTQGPVYGSFSLQQQVNVTK